VVTAAGPGIGRAIDQYPVVVDGPLSLEGEG